MKITITVLLLLVCTLSFGQVSWESTTYDFGTIKKGKENFGTFELTNTTSDSIQIEVIRVDCSCTSTEFPEHKIAPNETASVKVGFLSFHKGTFEKTLRLFYYDQKNVEKLTIKGTVIR